MKKAQHFAVPEDRTVWDQPQYFFPTYENDALLCSLEDDEEDETEDRDDFAQNTDA